MRVVLSAQALQDLEQIGDWIARDNPVRAKSFVLELIGKAHGIADGPEQYPLVPRYAHQGVRRRIHGNYAIFYTVDAETVAVIHVLHGAQDYGAILFPDE